MLDTFLFFTLQYVFICRLIRIIYHTLLCANLSGHVCCLCFHFLYIVSLMGTQSKYLLEQLKNITSFIAQQIIFCILFIFLIRHSLAKNHFCPLHCYVISSAHRIIYEKLFYKAPAKNCSWRKCQNSLFFIVLGTSIF